MKTDVTAIGNIVVETPDVLTAAHVATNVAGTNSVRGRLCWLGRYYRWTTLQQYERHGGFTVVESEA